MTPFSPCMMSCSESPHGMQNAASIQRRRDMPWFHSAHSPHSRPKRRRQTDGWTARWLWLRSRAPVETAEDALTGVPVETYCRASTQGAQRCIQHLACRCAPRRPHDFGPRLKGALQKHLPGNACTRRRSLSQGSTPPTSLSWPVNVICIWFIAYAVARKESIAIICHLSTPRREPRGDTGYGRTGRTGIFADLCTRCIALLWRLYTGCIWQRETIASDAQATDSDSRGSATIGFSCK
jgi:hypothetical protein